MDMFWAAAGTLTITALMFVLVPLYRRADQETDRTAYDVHVFRDQFAEITRDVEQGFLSADQAAMARSEVERRLLAAADSDEKELPGIGTVLHWTMVTAIVFAVPVGILSVYMMLGDPNLPDNPLTNRTDELSKVADSKQFSDMADKLLARLEKNPDDAAGWAMLGRTYRVIGRPADSAKAYSRAYALSPDDPVVAIDYGEALVVAEKGHVTEAARMAFEKALALDPRNLKGLYFLGVAKAQTDGQLPEAIRIWEGIVKDAPPDAPWLTDLRKLIARAKDR